MILDIQYFLFIYLHTFVQYSLHLSMVGDCMKRYGRGLSKLCKVEQDLATGLDQEGEFVNDPVKILMPLLFERTIRYIIVHSNSK